MRPVFSLVKLYVNYDVIINNHVGFPQGNDNGEIINLPGL